MADKTCVHYEYLFDDLKSSTNGDHYCKIRRVIADTMKGFYEQGRCEHDYHPRCPIFLAHRKRLESEAELEKDREKILIGLAFSD